MHAASTHCKVTWAFSKYLTKGHINISSLNYLQILKRRKVIDHGSDLNICRRR